MEQEIKTDIFPSSLSSLPLRMSFEEFLEWSDEDIWAEWVNGEVIPMGPVSLWHQNVALFLSTLLHHFVEAKDRGIILTAPFVMKTGVRLSGREPDIIFIARERQKYLRSNYLNGPANLAIEVISPDSRTRDKVDKFHEYEQGGVEEYWIIDPIHSQAEFYYRGKDSVFVPILVNKEGIFQSIVLDGLWIKVDWLWQEPLPKLMSVLRAWELV